MARVDPATIRRVRRALGKIEDLHERNTMVYEAVKVAAEGDEEIELLATTLSDNVRMMGRVTALELLAWLGWWLIENEDEENIP